MIYSTSAINNHTRSTLAKKLLLQQTKLAVKIDRLTRYPVLGEACVASDSNKVVFECWCAECKEITSTIITTDALPEWLR